MNRIILTDIFLLLSLIPTAISGIGLHIAGHTTLHITYHNWAVFHSISVIAFTISLFFHIKGHLAWYKSLFKTGLGKKSPVTLLISIVAIATMVSGIIVAVFSETPNHPIGLWHYAIGIILTAIATGHIIKRHKAFTNIKRKQ